jgi:exosome complex exonuclease DIS3/RRP44
VCYEKLDESQWISKPVYIVDEEEELDLIDETTISENQKRLNIKQKIDESSKQPLGRVRGILRRNRNQYCGTVFYPKDLNVSVDEKTKNIQTHSIFIPIDPKYPNFLIKLYQSERYYNQRILVKLDSWLDGIIYQVLTS